MRVQKLILFVLCLLSPFFTYAKTAQEIFQNAINYTVKIRTSVETPYLQDSRGVSMGAGFVVNREKGWIMTNAHVSSRSPAELKVAFKDKPFVVAKKIYVDPFLDLAIISIDPKNIPKTIIQAPIDCKLFPKIGTAVGAFGHPFGLEFTGTRGIISGEADDDLGKFLRTDAAVNPGNSGGPLISIKSGKVVGINSARAEDGRTTNQNTNFAIPMPYACHVLNQLKAGNDPSPAVTHLSYFEPQFDLIELIVARNFGDPKKVPLKTGDKILKVENYPFPIKNIGGFMDALRLKVKNVKITIERNGKQETITASFDRAALITEAKVISINGAIIGPSSYVDINLFPNQLPIQIYSIIPGSYANFISMPFGALINAIDGKTFNTAEEAYAYLEAKAKSENKLANIETMGLQRREIDQIFSHKQNFLPIDNLEIIKGQ